MYKIKVIRVYVCVYVCVLLKTIGINLRENYKKCSAILGV